MKIGRKVYKLRTERKMSQTELARLLEISQTTLHNIESEKSKKTDFTLIDKICEIFDIEISHFTENFILNENITNNDDDRNDFIPFEHLVDTFKKIIDDNKAKNEKIKSLEQKIANMEK